MSDSRLRELERRWKEDNTPESQEAYVRELQRRGGLVYRLPAAGDCPFRISEWLVEPEQRVEPEQSIAEIEGVKMTIEYQVDISGVIYPIEPIRSWPVPTPPPGTVLAVVIPDSQGEPDITDEIGLLRCGPGPDASGVEMYWREREQDVVLHSPGWLWRPWSPGRLAGEQVERAARVLEDLNVQAHAQGLTPGYKMHRSVGGGTEAWLSFETTVPFDARHRIRAETVRRVVDRLADLMTADNDVIRRAVLGESE